MDEKPFKCIGCQFYHVTWDKDHPHGCKGYGFKSQELPWLLVKKISGVDCLLFKPKTAGQKGKE